MTRRIVALFAALLAALSLAAPASAQELRMARSPEEFPEAMLTLQDSIKAHGYTVARVQRVDVGLTSMGYKTDKYRVVFFGREPEMDQLIAKHPELVAYLPLKVAIFAEGKETLVVGANLQQVFGFFHMADVDAAAAKWDKDLAGILDDVRKAD